MTVQEPDLAITMYKKLKKGKVTDAEYEDLFFSGETVADIDTVMNLKSKSIPEGTEKGRTKKEGAKGKGKGGDSDDSDDSDDMSE